MSWLTPIEDLRSHLSDGPTDKLSYRKRVVGVQDGVLTKFKTFEYRRLTDLTTVVAPLGVYVNGALVPVTSDDLVSGEFEITTAPLNGDTVEATYYSQWFVDTELQTFLTFANQWAGQGEDYTQCPVGLRPAVLEYCACVAYRKLAVWWSRNISETYMFQDAPQKDRFAVVDSYTKLADSFCDRAEKLRNDYFSRQGQANAPLFGTARGRVRDVPPQS